MIKRERIGVGAPESLASDLPAVALEFSKNAKLVEENSKVPWKKWSLGLQFECYKGVNGDVKAALSKLFHNKCAYCETSLDVRYMHTEHYRPKKEVSEIDCKHQRGYWWLGAEWTNLLPACDFCNNSPGKDHPTGENYGSGKGTRFPLLPHSPRAMLPGEELHESPVLIDPSSDEPADYFTFKRFDKYFFAVVNHLPKTWQQTRAHGSIEIYGLNNPGLTRQRSKHLERVMDSARSCVRAAIALNKAIVEKQGADTVSMAESDIDEAVSALYKNYLTPECEYLHATVRCVEAEFIAAGLSLKALLGGRDLYIPLTKLS